MLSGNDNLRAGSRFLASASSGVFANLSSVRRLSIYHGKLFREFLVQGSIVCLGAYVSLMDFCERLFFNVVNKFIDISDDGKSSWRSTAVSAASYVMTFLIGFLVIIECLMAIVHALSIISLAVLSLFIVHNIVHTAILGLNHLSREVVELWNSIWSDPMHNLRVGASAFERGFEAALHRISLFALSAIYITPSVLTAVFSVALNPLYMLLNTVFPNLDLEENRVTKQELLAMAQSVPQRIDAVLTASADKITSNSVMSPPMRSVEEAKAAATEVVELVEVIHSDLSSYISQIKRQFKGKMVDQDLSTDAEVMSALDSISNCKDSVGAFKAVGSALLSKLEQADETQSASAERKTAIKILKLLERSSYTLDSFSDRIYFRVDASRELFNEHQREVSGLDKAQTSVTGVSAEPIQLSACMARAG